jgi:hypothetical protein
MATCWLGQVVHSQRLGSFYSKIPGITCMSDQDQADIRLAVARLKQEHLDFDAAIQAMIQVGCDQLRIQRMKKKKLIIKDKLIELEDKITPDIIA